VLLFCEPRGKRVSKSGSVKQSAIFQLLLVVPETVLVLVRLIPAAQANKMQLSLKLPDPGRELYVEGAQI